MSFQQELLGLVQEINEEQIPVIVEGIKDRQALQDLGVEQIITLNKPLYQIAEELNADEVVILTDLDAEGKHLYGRLCRECMRLGIKVNNRLREFLFRETPLSHIEGLPRYLDNLNNNPNNKTGPEGTIGSFLCKSISWDFRTK